MNVAKATPSLLHLLSASGLGLRRTSLTADLLTSSNLQLFAGGIAEKQASSEEMSDGESQNVGAESPAQEKGLLLPDEARRTKAAAARARARGSAPSGDEREEELSEDGTDTGESHRP